MSNMVELQALEAKVDRLTEVIEEMVEKQDEIVEKLSNMSVDNGGFYTFDLNED